MQEPGKQTSHAALRNSQVVSITSSIPVPHTIPQLAPGITYKLRIRQSLLPGAKNAVGRAVVGVIVVVPVGLISRPVRHVVLAERNEQWVGCYDALHTN